MVRGEWGEWSVAGLLREIRADQALADSGRDSALGGALSVAGRIRTYRRDNARFMATAGNAVGRYMSFNLFESAALSTAGSVDLLPSAGGFVSYQHWWCDRWRSNLSLGAAYIDREVRVPGLTELAYSLHANLLWSPVLEATLGLEWIHARRLLEDDTDGELNRLQFTALYKF